MICFSYFPQVLRSMVGYDEQNTILLPPRVPGSQLPKQLLQHYARTNVNNRDENSVLGGIGSEVDGLVSNELSNLTESSSGNVVPSHHQHVVQDSSNETNLESKNSEGTTEFFFFSCL